MADSDLSEYELQRLENIKRNNALLDRLGLGSHPLVPRKAATKPPAAARPPATKKRGRFEGAPSRPPSRVSKRLRQQEQSSAQSGAGGKEEEDGEEEEDGGDEEESGVDYDATPFEPADLDDHEFQAYVKLKKWRLDRSRELELE